MRFSIQSNVIGCGLLLVLAAGAHAQTYGHPPYAGDDYYRGPVYERPYGGNGWALYEQVEQDLNRAAFDVYGSHRRIDHARKEVRDVERQLRRGRFDRDEMGEAIRAVDHVLDNSPLPEADRAALWRDMEQMRRFRDGGYGY